MNKKKYSKIGNTYHPEPMEIETSESEAKGNRWRVWKDNIKFYFEYDSGHFLSEMKIIEITEFDFEYIKSGKISEKELAKKYR